jgi:hypothetical protein
MVPNYCILWHGVLVARSYGPLESLCSEFAMCAGLQGRVLHTSIQAKGRQGPTSDNLFDRFLATVRPGYKAEAPVCYYLNLLFICVREFLCMGSHSVFFGCRRLSEVTRLLV